MNKDDVLRCTPRKQEFHQEQLENFLGIKAKGIAMHSVLLARNGKVFTEGYYAPWNASMNHRMFSQTKSLVSLAIGCLQNEGKLHLDDTIVSYFPEYVPIDTTSVFLNGNDNPSYVDDENLPYDDHIQKKI